ncbi:MAG: resuscitation-promoting factor RpfB, partial [Patescibacteria group bacterium]|nr:resuscitation-promoting factor RpfB [Patescibacteria group bacterium]
MLYLRVINLSTLLLKSLKMIFIKSVHILEKGSQWCEKLFMTSIFSIHNHRKVSKQNPTLRASYYAFLLAVIAIPFLSRQAFASGYTGTAQVYVDGKTLNVATSAITVADAVKDAGVTLSEKDKVEPSLDTEISDGYKINIYRSVPVTIEDKNATVEIETSHKTADAITEEAGLALHPEDTYMFKASDLSSNDLQPGITLKVDRAESIKLNLYGAITDVRTQAKTAGEFLKEKNLTLQENDFLIVPDETPISEGLTVGIQNSFREVVVQDEVIAMPEEIIKDINRDTSIREVQVA